MSAHAGFIAGVHLWLVKINSLTEPDSIFIGVCRGCMPLDQDPQDLRDRTYYLRCGAGHQLQVSYYIII